MFSSSVTEVKEVRYTFSILYWMY